MYDIESMGFGERLRNSIKLAGITQKELAEKIGVAKTSVNNYVGGRIPDAIILYKICKCLNITMEWLLDGKEENPTNVVLNKEELELLNLYKECSNNHKDDIIKKIKSYLSNPTYTFEKNMNNLSENEAKIIELFRLLNTTDKIKIEGIIESKLMDNHESKKGLSSNYHNGENAATVEDGIA